MQQSGSTGAAALLTPQSDMPSSASRAWLSLLHWVRNPTHPADSPRRAVPIWCAEKTANWSGTAPVCFTCAKYSSKAGLLPCAAATPPLVTLAGPASAAGCRSPKEKRPAGELSRVSTDSAPAAAMLLRPSSSPCTGRAPRLGKQPQLQLPWSTRHTNNTHNSSTRNFHPARVCNRCSPATSTHRPPSWRPHPPWTACS